MAHTLFISDVHLSPDQPEITERFMRFVQGPAHEADAVYILGDFFDLWLGHDVNTDWSTSILSRLQSLATSGTLVYFMHGNHDFLMETCHLEAFDIQFIEDPTVIDLYGTKTVLLHGDSLCTLDKNHMRLRKLLRNTRFQRIFRALPASWRQALANELKKQSRNACKDKNTAIMDVNPETVDDIFKETGAKQMIHGHTHRPALHPNQRFVMDAWHDHTSILKIDERGTTTLYDTVEMTTPIIVKNDV